VRGRSLSAPGEQPWPPLRLAWTAAAVLAVGNSLSFVDRTVLTLLVEPIEADLQISDTSVSLLTGLGFTVFYVLIGLPVARLADRGNRRNIIAACMFVWSTMTAACGLAWNYTSLLLARAGTGAGEGGLSPSAQSMLADYFPRERLPAALGLFSSGIYVGHGLALLLGGAVIAATSSAGSVEVPLLGVLKPWQVAFIVLGAPGVLLALLMTTVKEPPRRGVPTEGRSSTQTLWDQFNARRAQYLLLFAGCALLILHGNATNVWIPSFFARKFQWDAAQTGAAYGTVVLLFGVSGALAGGFCANRLRRKGHADANARAIQYGLLALLPFAVLFPLANDPYLSLLLIAGMNFFAGFPFAGAYAALQELTPNRMRAQVAAAFAVCMNVIGGGLGPTLVAVFTDFVFGDRNQLPYSLVIAAALTLPAAVAFFIALRRRLDTP
jgi:MFS family permease